MIREETPCVIFVIVVLGVAVAVARSDDAVVEFVDAACRREAFALVLGDRGGRAAEALRLHRFQHVAVVQLIARGEEAP